MVSDTAADHQTDTTELESLRSRWLQWDNDEESRAQINAALAPELRAWMVPRIAFGTAGLRGQMGPGSARMNKVTVLQASQGLAVYALKTVPDALQRGVVIGHDHRHNSKDFAALTALAFKVKGFKVYFLGLVHTPSVPFTVNMENASCGVMITASHNPKQDNGYKVYWENACQIIPPHDAGIAEEIDRNLDPWSWDVSQVADILAAPISIDRFYFQEFGRLKFRPIAKVFELLLETDIKFVYTAMHGVGYRYAKAALEFLGIPSERLVSVPEQQEPDPDFPTVAFPNPEEHGALDLAIDLADKTGAAVIFANDPDADRFACAFKSASGWRQLTGDEVGIILAEYIITQLKCRGGKLLAMLSSTVSSQVLYEICRHHHIKYTETLTGFKWLGNGALALELDDYEVPLAYEEALGYMVGPTHDKDGISALFVFAQAALDLSARFDDELNRIYQFTGYYAQHNGYYKVQPSAVGPIFDSIRSRGEPFPSNVGPLEIRTWRDLTTGYDSETENNVPALPVSASAEMVTFQLAGKSSLLGRVTLRGSGTEPKLKLYIEAKGQTLKIAERFAKEIWDTLADNWFQDLQGSQVEN